LNKDKTVEPRRRGAAGYPLGPSLLMAGAAVSSFTTTVQADERGLRS